MVHNTPTYYYYYYYYVTLINMKNVGEVMGWGKLWGARISTKIIAVAFMSVLKVLMQTASSNVRLVTVIMQEYHIILMHPVLF